MSRRARVAPAEVPASPWPARLGLAAMVVASALVRLRIAGLPLERDEGEYAYFGQLILRGEWPYVAAHNMKLPGVYYAYAAILSLFGETDVAIRVALLLVNAATIVLVATLARRFAGELASLTAAAVYAVLSLGTVVLGFTANTEHFVLLPAIAGLLLLQDGAASSARLLAAGLLLGIGVVMKQPGAFFVACGAAWLVVSGTSPARVVRALAIFGVGAVLPYAAVCLAMLAGGAFEPFWFWTVVYLREYGTMIDAASGLPELYGQLGRMLAASPLTWLLAAAGVAALATTRFDRRARLQIAALVLTSAAAVFNGSRERCRMRKRMFVREKPAKFNFGICSFLNTAERFQDQAMAISDRRVRLFDRDQGSGQQVFFCSSQSSKSGTPPRNQLAPLHSGKCCATGNRL